MSNGGVSPFDDVVAGTFERLLFRGISPGDLAHMRAALADGMPFGDWLTSVLHSPEFQLKQEQFLRAYTAFGSDAEGRPPPPVPGGPASYAAVQLRLERPTALGQAGDLLTVPNDRVILPAVLSAGAWLPEQLEFFAQHTDPAQAYTLVDIGANVGLVSRQMLLRFGNIGLAHCVEPDAANFAALGANLARFGPAAVRLHNLALGAEEGTITFYADAENCGNRSVHADAMRDRPFTTTTLPVVAAGPWLARHLDGAGPIIWKSDTQGHDETIVAAAPWPVWRRVRCAVMELWRIRKGGPLPAGFLDRIADMPQRLLGNEEISADGVARYLASEDWTFDDLYLWR